MKHLKLYERFKPEKTLQEYLDSLKDEDDKPDTVLYCVGENLTDLNGIEKLTNLKEIDCDDNQLTSLKGVEKLTKLDIINCSNNPWKYPLPIELVDRFEITYNLENFERFTSYDCQKKFIEQDIGNINDFKPNWWREDIKKEYPHYFEANAMGFFNVK